VDYLVKIESPRGFPYITAGILPVVK